MVRFLSTTLSQLITPSCFFPLSKARCELFELLGDFPHIFLFIMKTLFLSNELIKVEAPFTLQKIFGTARIKMGRVPNEIVLISHLHVLFPTVLNVVKLCFGTDERLNISASVLDHYYLMLLTWRTKST